MPTIPGNNRLKIQEEILAPLKRGRGYGPAWVTRTLQGIMIPNFVLYIKKERLLKAALAYVEELRDHHVPMLRASSGSDRKRGFRIFTGSSGLHFFLDRGNNVC